MTGFRNRFAQQTRRGDSRPGPLPLGSTARGSDHAGSSILDAPRGPNRDHDIPAECIQKPNESVDGEAVEPASQKGRDFRLVDAEEFRGACLAELPFGGDV